MKPFNLEAALAGAPVVNKFGNKVRIVDTNHNTARGPLRMGTHNPIVCPYGKPGDWLWVRETCRAEELPSGLAVVRYLADDAFIPIDNSEEAADQWIDLRDYGKRASPVAPIRTVPAIHMPRWASRITLEIVSVRVERLQDISEVNTWSEGYPVPDGINWEHDVRGRCWFRNLWESINGPESWDANPWVWVIEFCRVDNHTHG